ncbi:MAG TPA: hypothetical protein VEM96_12205 [Pyrinomonadaceae bacterium]|nr:hypothetical protein [Pyrinomonadaceae bacterium]
MNERLAKERAETDALKREALRLGVGEIPRNPGWWWEDVDNFGGSLQEWDFVRDDYTYLTEIGKAGARRLIREEMRKDIEWRRKESQWKLTIAGMIVGWVLGALGILIGLFALLKK